MIENKQTTERGQEAETLTLSEHLVFWNESGKR
jgi:hypothetical protein